MSSDATLPGVMTSPRGIGLSLGREDKADGALEASPMVREILETGIKYRPPDPPLPALFIGSPPIVVCVLSKLNEVCAVAPPTFFI